MVCGGIDFPVGGASGWQMLYDRYVYIDGLTPVCLACVLVSADGSSCIHIPRLSLALILDVLVDAEE